MLIVNWVLSRIITSIFPWSPKTDFTALQNVRKLRETIDDKHLGQLRYLLGLGGIDVNIRDNGNRTALHYIASQRGGGLEVAKILIANGADFYARDEKGNTPLHIAAMSNNTELINTLLEVQFGNIYSSVTVKQGRSTDLASVNNLGQTPFHLAKNFKSMRALLSAEGKDLTPVINKKLSEEYRRAALSGYIKKDKNGNTPLHIAAQSGQIKIARLLLEGRSFLINIRNNMGQTALDLAAKEAHSKIAYFLRNNGAKASGLGLKIDRTISVNSKDKKGAIALHRAIADIGQNSLPEEFLLSRQEAINTLLADGADVNLPDRKGDTPLHLAARCVNSLEITFKLLGRKASPNVKNKIGATPLHEAARIGANKTIEQLISYGAQVDLKDLDGLTPLSWALMNSDQQAGIRAVRVLIKHGANIEQKIGGETALHRAVKLGFIKTVKSLVKRGADVNAIDGQKRTALDLASSNDKELISFLKQNGAKTSEDFFGIASSQHTSLLNPPTSGAMSDYEIRILRDRSKIMIREKTYFKVLEQVSKALKETGIGGGGRSINTATIYDLGEAMWKKILNGDTTPLNFPYKKLLKEWKGSLKQSDKFIDSIELAMDKLGKDEEFKLGILQANEQDRSKQLVNIAPASLLVNTNLQAIGNSSGLLEIR